MTTTDIILRDDNDWTQFSEENRDALLEMYATVEDAYVAACQGGIQIGGGAAPEFFISFGD